MTHPSHHRLAVVALPILIAACGDAGTATPEAPPPLPKGAAAFSGPIVARDSSAGLRLLVQVQPAAPPRQTGQVWLTVGAATVLLRADGARGAAADFVPGRAVRAWSNPPYVATDPGLARADTLVLDPVPTR
jgi:hypothetical protein